MNFNTILKHSLCQLMLLIITLLTLPASADPAITAFDAGDYEQAEQLLKSKTNPEFKLYLARTKMHLGKLDDAEDLMKEIIKEQPSNSEVHYWFARIYSQQAANASIFFAPGYASDAKEHFIKAIELEPKNTDAIRGLMGFYSQAPSIVGGSMKEAHKLAIKLTEIDPEAGLLAQMDLHHREKNSDKVDSLLDQITEQYSDSANAMFNVGLIYQTKKEYAKALTSFTNATRANTSQILESLSEEEQKVVVRAARGATYQIGRNAVLSNTEIEKGIQALETYLGYELFAGQPSHNWARTRLAALYLKQGNKPKAKELVVIAIKDNSDGGPQKLAKKLLKKINGA